MSAALPAARRSWRASAPVRLTLADGGGSVSAGSADRARRVIPPLAISPPPPDAAEDEASTYGRAHRAHFVANAPARALAAWTRYLAAFPQGSFAPEASFNRAICLIRLGRYAQASRALRPFADGPAGAYRREEARQLLDWLGVPPV